MPRGAWRTTGVVPLHHFEELCDILRTYDVTFSLGDVLPRLDRGRHDTASWPS